MQRFLALDAKFKAIICPSEITAKTLNDNRMLDFYQSSKMQEIPK